MTPDKEKTSETKDTNDSDSTDTKGKDSGAKSKDSGGEGKDPGGKAQETAAKEKDPGGKGKETESKGKEKEIVKGRSKEEKREDSPLMASLKRFHAKYLAPQGEDGHYTLIHDVLIAIIVVLVIIIAIYAYTRTWPPVVVVESGSMQHSTDSSSLGVIDTGDIVMVKSVDSEDDITTWAEGKEKGYKTYGEYGDVIIYDKNGKGGTPVIHRAIVYIRVNTTNKEPGDPFTFDVPEWGIYNNRTIDYYIPELNLQIRYTPTRGHDGYLTKGDNRYTNRRIDQESGISDIDGVVVEQVSINWVLGVARGEVPWFGLIKLKINGNDGWDAAPDNSKTNLKVSLVLLLGIPILLNVLYYIFSMKLEPLEDDGKEGKGTSGGKKDTGKSKDPGKKGKGEAKGSGSRSHSSREDKVKIGKKGGR